DIQIDVAIKIEDVQELFEVITGDLALLAQPLLGHLDFPLRHGTASVVTADRRTCPDDEYLPQVWDKAPGAGASGTLSVYAFLGGQRFFFFFFLSFALEPPAFWAGLLRCPPGGWGFCPGRGFAPGAG